MSSEASNRPSRRSLVVIETHPIQYRAPVYRALQERCRVPVTVIYGSDFSLAGYYDPEFRSEFAWDTDLLSGYGHIFLSKTTEGGARTYETVSTRGLSRALCNLAPRAILLTGYSPRFHQWAWLHAWRTRQPILFRGETAERAQAAGTLTLGIRDRVLRGLYRRCSKLLYIGKRSQDHLASHGCPDEKLIFSPYCVDVAAFQVDEISRQALRTQMRTSLGIGENDTVLIFSGKLSERKGPDLLIDAIKALTPEDRAKTVILFLGNGEMLSALQDQANRTPQVSVRFLGFQNQKQISPYFHAADLFVLPSRRRETWGLVVNEALHHGLPCVVSASVGCGPDLIAAETTGEVFETGSVEALAAALKSACALVGRLEIREACRARVAGYSVDKAAEGIAEAYRAVAGHAE
jgi:glycosyltransferase involved in cell wall biosynthesis